MRAVAAPRLRTLIADVAPEDARLRSILAGDDLQFVRTTHDMEEALKGEAFDLSVVCIQFDESRMFETLDYIQKRSGGDGGRRLPVACIRGDSASKHSQSLEPYRQTIGELGADALIDFTAVPNGSAGNDLIRRQLYACVPMTRRMRKSTVYTRTLSHAADVLGGRERLALALNATAAEVMQWLTGIGFPPYAAYMRAQDVVAGHSASSTTFNVVPGTTIPPREPGSTLP